MVISRDDMEAFQEWQESEEYYSPKEDTMAKWDIPITVMQMVKEFAEVMGQEPSPKMSASLIGEEYTEWRSEYNSMSSCEHNRYDPKDELKELSDLVYVAYGYANARGWDLDEALKRIHQNNIGRCVQPDGSINRSPTGKILKNPNYEKVKLDDLV